MLWAPAGAGDAVYKASFGPSLQLSGNLVNTLLAIAWHGQRNTYGASPGAFSTVSRVRLLSTPFPIDGG